VYFVAVILKVLLVNLLAAVNFANVFLNKKRLENKKRQKRKKNVTNIKKTFKNVFFTSMQSTNINYTEQYLDEING